MGISFHWLLETGNGRLHFKNFPAVRYTLITPATRPKTKKRKKNQGLVPSHRSSAHPAHAPMTTASTNDNPTVLRPPSVRMVSAIDFFGGGTLPVIALS